LAFGRKGKPEYLSQIFTILDTLPLNIEESNFTNVKEREKLQHINVKLRLPPLIRTDEHTKKEFAEIGPFPLAKFVVDFWGKVKEFVYQLKRELIYAQSEETIRYERKPGSHLIIPDKFFLFIIEIWTLNSRSSPKKRLPP
jgi:hypothetical protein